MFDWRAEEVEILDACEGVDERFARRGYRLMATVNRRLGGARVVRRYLAEQARHAPPGRALRVLDIGAGGCDIPLTVNRWADRAGVALEWTALDPCGPAVDIARANIRRAGADNITLRDEDAFVHRPDQPYDCAVGSMFFHHLSDERILALLGHLRPFVRRGVLINDLWRSSLHWAGAAVLTAPLQRDLRHDALLSIRRGFRPAELRTLLGQLGDVRVEAGRAWLMRVWATVSWEG